MKPPRRFLKPPRRFLKPPPFASAQPLLIQEGSRRKKLPSSDEEGRRVSAGVVEPKM